MGLLLPATLCCIVIIVEIVISVWYYKKKVMGETGQGGTAPAEIATPAVEAAQIDAQMAMPNPAPGELQVELQVDGKKRSRFNIGTTADQIAFIRMVHAFGNTAPISVLASVQAFVDFARGSGFIVGVGPDTHFADVKWYDGDTAERVYARYDELLTAIDANFNGLSDSAREYALPVMKTELARCGNDECIRLPNIRNYVFHSKYSQPTPASTNDKFGDALSRMVGDKI